MRLLNITPSRLEQSLPNLGILTNVVELSHYEMIYIYHHIHESCEVQLRREHNHVFDKNAVEVYFKGFKIGYISQKVNAIVAKKLDNGKRVIAKVKSIQKQKYTPLSGLDIELMMM